MDLLPEDIEKRKILTKKIEKNDAVKDRLRNFRRDIADKVRNKKDEY